ncbi:MAG TPA: HAD family hydrolase [Planctomycetota bacterium]|jgi:phosphoglycolate phosphatase
MSYKAVLFDLDGTLLNTLDDLADSMNSALRELGCPEHPVNAYKHFVGDGVLTLAKRTLPNERLDDPTIQKAVTLMRAQYSQRWSAKTKPYPGILELLESLTARKIRCAVLSNKPDDFTKLMVAKMLSRGTFEHVAGARAGVPHKPDPAGALEIAKLMKLSPAEFVYLGDTNTDMRTAVSAGMFPVGALWGFREAKELSDNGAKVLVKEPREVLDLF